MSTPEACEQWFCRHLVGLMWYEGKVRDDGEFVAKPTYCCASACLVEFFDEHFLVTAGHVYADYSERQRKDGIVGKSFSLSDWWNPRATCPERIPFDFMAASHAHVLDEPNGLDFALIRLPQNTILKMLLQTIEPIPTTDWFKLNERQHEFYAILGTPDYLADSWEGTVEGRNVVDTIAVPRIVFVEPCETPDDLAETTFPLLVQKSQDIDRVNGMSGGPIVGFFRTSEGLKYELVAIQNRWRKKSRLVIGTRLNSVAWLVRQQVMAADSAPPE